MLKPVNAFLAPDNIDPKPLLYPNPVFNGLKLPDPKKFDNAPLPNTPPNDVPGIPKPIAPAIAALPIGLLITFFTPLTAFLTRLPSPYICLGI